MAAHVPRTVFAKSLVVTMAALPILPMLACADDPPPHANPPAPVDTETHNPPAPTELAPSASVTASSALAPSPSTTTASATVASVEWSITMGNGKCTAYMKESCPAGSSCNPPPPSLYECPKGIDARSYPIEVSTVAASSMCQAKYTVYGGGGNCPAGMHCNPPPPQEHTMSVPCPK